MHVSAFTALLLLIITGCNGGPHEPSPAADVSLLTELTQTTIDKGYATAALQVGDDAVWLAFTDSLRLFRPSDGRQVNAVALPPGHPVLELVQFKGDLIVRRRHGQILRLDPTGAGAWSTLQHPLADSLITGSHYARSLMLTGMAATDSALYLTAERGTILEYNGSEWVDRNPYLHMPEAERPLLVHMHAEKGSLYAVAPSLAIRLSGSQLDTLLIGSSCSLRTITVFESRVLVAGGHSVPCAAMKDLTTGPWRHQEFGNSFSDGANRVSQSSRKVALYNHRGDILLFTGADAEFFRYESDTPVLFVAPTQAGFVAVSTNESGTTISRLAHEEE